MIVQPFIKAIPDNYSFAQFGNSKINIQKGKGLILITPCGFFFSAYTISPSQLRECLNIAKSGISTVVYSVQQHGVCWFFCFLFFFSSSRGNWFTGCESTLHHRLTTQKGPEAVYPPDGADVKLQGTWPCALPAQHNSPTRLKPGIRALSPTIPSAHF